MLESILVLISVNYFCNLACVFALSLKFYWANLTSSFREVFYPANFPILFFNCSFYWLFCYILWRYSWIYLIIFWFWFADNRRFYWALLSYSSIPVFSFTSLVIFSWSVPIVLFIPSISFNLFLRLLTYWVFLSKAMVSSWILFLTY